MTFAPRTWVVGEVVTAALLNQEIRDQLNEMFAAWTTYTPTWSAATTAPSLGNGTIIGRHLKVGRRCTAAWILTIGSTTTFGSGAYSFSLPFQVANASVHHFGNARLVAAATWIGQTFVSPNGTTATCTFPQNSTTTTGASLSGTVPVTLAAGDQLRTQVEYQTAS